MIIIIKITKTSPILAIKKKNILIIIIITSMAMITKILKPTIYSW